MTEPTMNELQALFWQDIHQRESTNSIQFLSHDRIVWQGVGVYRSNTKAALLAVLTNVYPTCRDIIGDINFNQIAMSYVNQTPSTNPDMNQYGGGFPDFIAQCITEHKELKDFIYLEDLTRLEWMLETAYYTADEVPFDTTSFQQQSSILGELAILMLQPSIRILKTPYPIYTIWNSHQAGNIRQEYQALGQEQYLCVYRHGFHTQIQVINRHLYTLLNAILNKSNLGEITRLFSNESDLQRSLIACVNHQWLAGLYNNGYHNEG